MKKEYDLSKMKRIPNPYPKLLRKQVNLSLGIDVIQYFKEQATLTGKPYQHLIDEFLRRKILTIRLRKTLHKARGGQQGLAAAPSRAGTRRA